MGLKSFLRNHLAAVALGAFTYALAPQALGQPAPAVKVTSDAIGGTVTGPNGPEAGVWVIAETHELPTRFAKIVVTDDRGRYLLPQLPQANYKIWVRGYGLVDSPKVDGEVGQRLNLTAVPAPTEAAAAAYYPAIYWYSMLKIPPVSEFGKGDFPPKLTQPEWIFGIKSGGCIGCHQLGQKATRTIEPQLGTFANGEEAWTRRVQSGQSGIDMVRYAMGALGGTPFKYLGDWTDRVAKGELPHDKPGRPQGIERNIVVTEWDWGDEKHYLHDLVSTDRRNPNVNAYGPLYGSPEYSTDNIPILDPKTAKATVFKAPVRDADFNGPWGRPFAPNETPVMPSSYWGTERLWDTKINNHNSMLGEDGRVWMAASFRKAQNPDFCKQGSDLPSAKIVPLSDSERQLTVYDPKTGSYKFIDTCYSTHHLQFAYDKNDTLWMSGDFRVVGWLNTKVFDETGDAAKAQGWTPLVLDLVGDGKPHAYVEPNQPAEPGKDKRIIARAYAVMPSPVDSSVWYTSWEYPGALIRLNPGNNPPETALAERYNVPSPGFGPRGADIDSKGVVWASLASGQLASFDRSKCKGPLNGPTATGDHCPEGWTFYKYPGPGFAGIGDNSAEASYYTWVDQHDTLGLGKDVPISTGNENDALLALKDGKWVMLRVPYPLSFYTKGLDGRIDDPNAGWKGRGLWTTTGDRTPWLHELGKGATPMVVHVQMRPDPLAD